MILVGCGKSKLAHAAPAGDLYVGSLFRAARRYAIATGQRWAIVSAKYGLVLPDEVIEPYEQRLELRGAELSAWARSVVDKVETVAEAPHVELLAGSVYTAPIAGELARRGWSCRLPLHGLSLGARLRWLGNASRGVPWE